MKIDVKHTAKLANLIVSKDEEKVLEKQLDSTLDYIKRLNKIDTSKVEGTNEVNNLRNVWREDVVTPSLPQEKALMNAKKKYKGYFVVPAILNE